MGDELAHHIHILKAEIVTEENSADEIVNLARSLRQAGHDSLAATLFAVGRQLRIKALDLRGRLAAVSRFGRDDQLM